MLGNFPANKCRRMDFRNLYAQRLQKLVYLTLCTDRFMKISLCSSE